MQLFHLVQQAKWLPSRLLTVSHRIGPRGECGPPPVRRRLSRDSGNREIEKKETNCSLAELAAVRSAALRPYVAWPNHQNITFKASHTNTKTKATAAGFRVHWAGVSRGSEVAPYTKP